jgi:hypothetical protein
MKVYVEQEEWWGWLILHTASHGSRYEVELEVDEETAARWKSVMEAADAVEQEIGAAVRAQHRDKW